MNNFKEFQEKTLDAAIAAACAYYDAPREKLEIEIIEDAKSGIFGIVGARKARIQARRAQLPDLGRAARSRAEKNAPASVEAARSELSTARDDAPAESKPARQEGDLPQKSQEDRQKKRGRRTNGRTDRSEGGNAPSACAIADEEHTYDAVRESDAAAGIEPETPRERGKRKTRGGDSDAAQEAAGNENGGEQDNAALPPRVALTELDQEKLVRVAAETIRTLVESIADDVSIEVNVGTDRLQVRVDCADTGLLIGRDGQNLAAIQYLGTRIIARAMDAQVRLQLDAGDYHSRQDSRLQELALSLAEKVKQTGRSQSTRPLSAYQRRLIHLCLQDDPEVQTRSSGEGAMKRVVILRCRDREFPED